MAVVLGINAKALVTSRGVTLENEMDMDIVA